MLRRIHGFRFLIIQMLCTVPMQNALYFCTEDVFSGEDGEAELRRCHHYALNVPFYTHFTSPIRRMADVVVHRVLFDLLEGNDPETSYVSGAAHATTRPPN